MESLKQIYKNKINEVASQSNLNKLQKKQRIGAFVNNTLYILDLIQTRENQKNKLLVNNEFVKNITGEYSWISREEFKTKIKNNVLFQECMQFLKQNELIDVFKKDGREYYIHFAHYDQGIEQCSKGYKLTDKCKQVLANTTQKQFDDFCKQFEITQRKKYTPPTPKDVMSKVKAEYWFKNTKANIERVLENNLELEFHPTTVQELMDSYNAQRYFDGEKLLTKEQIEVQISHKLDEFANKDFSYNVRLYTAFTNIPRAWRKYVTTKEGKNVTELFDIHSSVLNILPLVCRIVLLKNGCDIETFKEFEAEEKVLEFMLQKDVYTAIGGDEYKRQEIKDSLMKVLFSNNKSFENVANIELTGTGKIKHNAANRIRFWLRDNFSTMFDVLAHFEQVEKKGEQKSYKKFKSLYWKAFQELETELMCELNRRVEKQFGIKVYGLHDGCFFDSCMYSTVKNDEMVEYCKCEYKKLKEELKQLIEAKYKDQVKVEVPKPVYKAVENKIVKEEVEEHLDQVALTALLAGTEQFT